MNDNERGLTFTERLALLSKLGNSGGGGGGEGGLPEVSNADNGKILSVANGGWTKTVPIWGYGLSMFTLEVNYDEDNGTVISTSMTAAEIDSLMSNPPSDFHGNRAMMIINFVYQDNDEWIVDYSRIMPAIVGYMGVSSSYTYFLETNPLMVEKIEGNIVATEFRVALSSNGSKTLSTESYTLSATRRE